MSIEDIVAKPIFAITPDEQKPYGPWTQLGYGVAGAAIPVTALKVLGHILKKPQTFKSLIPSAIGGFAAGMSILPLESKFIEYKKQKQAKEMLEALGQSGFPENDPGRHIKGIGNTLSSLKSRLSNAMPFSKQADLGSAVAGAVGKGIWGSAKFIGRNLLPAGKNPSWHRRIAGIAVKGTALGGIGYGAYKSTDFVRARQPHNYDQYLRNNIIAGKINPSELNESELTSVRQLGLK